MSIGSSESELEESASSAGPASVRDDELARLFPGDSEMAIRCRALDWSRTSLGPVQGWPQALRLLVQVCLGSPFPINLWCGPDMALIYNDGYARLLGERHPEALGKPGAEVWAEIWDELGPLFERIAAGGPPAYHEDQSFVIRRNSADGDEVRSNKGWFTFSLSAIRDDRGAIVAYLNIATETTARVQVQLEADAARAVAESAESRLREVFAQAPVAVCVLSGPEHVYELVNPLYQRFFPGRKLLGLPIRDALPELEGQSVYELLDRVRQTGEAYVASEYTIRVDRMGRGEEEDATFNFVYQPVRDADGTVTSIAVVVTDVTELVQARQTAETARAEAEQSMRAAERANAVKSQFLAMMSHELRTPLNAIGGYMELLQMGVYGTLSEEQRAAVSRVQTSQRHLLGLINGVLNFARLEAGHVDYQLTDVDTAAVLHEVRRLTAEQVATRGLTMEIDDRSDSGEPLPAVRADADKLRQVLLNLLSNAIKFTSPGGRIAVRGTANASHVRITVSDTGRGIPADQIGNIFEPFVQVDWTFTSSHEGTGLGLSISRDLARGMGGDLTVVSKPGIGSIFTLELMRAA